MYRKIISVIGDGKIEPNEKKYQLAFETGKLLVDEGYRIQSGGLGGVMSAVFEGAHSSAKYTNGDTIAIIPSFDVGQANQFADIVIPTGLDILRNAVVVNSSAVVAIGGGAGTLSEMAIAWSLFKLVIGYVGIDGWSAKLAEQKLDNRIRYEAIPDDRVYGVATSEQMMTVLTENISRYMRVHTAIKERK